MKAFCMASMIAIAVLVLTGVGAWLVLARRLGSPDESFVVGQLQTLNWLLCRLWFRLELPARDPMPAVGPFLVISNHTCGADPFLLAACTRRLIAFMMAAEFFRWGAVAWIFRATGVIPVTRSGQDLPATREAVRRLRERKIGVGMFPEGRIAPPEGMLPGRPGVALIALRADVPVVPAFITGTPRTTHIAAAFRLGGHVRIRFGRPIRPEDLPPGNGNRDHLEAITELFMKRIVELDPTGRQTDPGVVRRLRRVIESE